MAFDVQFSRSAMFHPFFGSNSATSTPVLCRAYSLSVTCSWHVPVISTPDSGGIGRIRLLISSNSLIFLEQMVLDLSRSPETARDRYPCEAPAQPAFQLGSELHTAASVVDVDLDELLHS